MNEKFLALGSTGTAFLASLCCLGPLVLGALGLGGAALASTFAPLRPYFLAATALLLALGFCAVYRRPAVAPSCEGEVCAPESRMRRAAKPLLWLATLATLALALFPYYGGTLVNVSLAKAASPAATKLETVNLQIGGMTCEACAGVVKNTLSEVPGVAAAQVDFPAGRATVKYDPAQADVAQLIEAVNATGYTASLPDGKDE